MKCPLCNGLSGEPPSVRVVLPFRNVESALIETRSVTICWVCAGEIAEEVSALGTDAEMFEDEEDDAQVTTFYIETPCLTHGAASGSAATWKLNNYEAKSVGDAIEMAAKFWETNGWQVAGHSRDVTESVLATRKAKTT